MMVIWPGMMMTKSPGLRLLRSIDLCKFACPTRERFGAARSRSMKLFEPIRSALERCTRPDCNCGNSSGIRRPGGKIKFPAAGKGPVLRLLSVGQSKIITAGESNANRCAQPTVRNRIACSFSSHQPAHDGLAATVRGLNNPGLELLRSGRSPENSAFFVLRSMHPRVPNLGEAPLIGAVRSIPPPTAGEWTQSSRGH